MKESSMKLSDKIFKKRRLSDYLMYTAVIIGGIILDQITKILAEVFLKSNGTFPIIKNALHLTYVENRGAAFGMLADSRWLFMVVSVVAILVFGAYLYLGHAESTLSAVALAMMTSGGIGNMIDRIFRGYVIDFIDFRLINFAVFNGADSLVCVGAGLLILSLLLGLHTDSVNRQSKDTGNGGNNNGADGDGTADRGDGDI